MKKVLCVFLCICLMISLTGCRREKQEKSIPLQAAVESGEENAGSLSVHVMGGSYSLSYEQTQNITVMRQIQPRDGYAVLFGSVYRQEKTGYYMEEFGPEKSSTQLLNCQENAMLTAFCADAEKLYYSEMQVGDEATDWRLLASGAEIKISGTETRDAPISDIWTDDEKILLSAQKRVICLAVSGEFLWEQPVMAERFFEGRSGAVYLLDNANQFHVVDPDAGTLTYAAELPALFRTDGVIFSGENSLYDCLIVANNALFGWNIGAEEADQLLSFDAVGLAAPLIDSFACIAENIYIGTMWHRGDGCDRLFTICPSDAAASEHRTLHIAGLGRPMVVSMAIADFHSLHPEYTVEYLDITERYGDQAQTELNMDLLYGDCPDLLFVNGLPLETYEHRGMLENLYGFIDADPELDRDAFLTNLLTALETADGKLFQIPLTWSASGVAGLQQTVGNLQEWDFSALVAMMEQNQNCKSVFYGDRPEQLAQELLFQAPTAFVNYDTAQSEFDSPEFLEFLRSVMKVKAAEETGYENENAVDALLHGEVLLEKVMFSSVDAFAAVEERYGGKLAYIGYPCCEGYDFYLNQPMAIPVRAAEKEAAWEFLKMLISSDYFAMGRGWRALQQSVDASFRQAKEIGTDDAITEKLHAILTDMHTAVYYDAAVLETVQEELPYYLQGKYSDTETAEAIDRRVQLYLDEMFAETG